MDNEIQLLHTISQGADMGQDSLRQVLEKASDPQLKQALQTQIKEYDKIFQSANQLLKSHGATAKKAPSLSKMQSQMMVSLETMMADDANSKIAEMVMQGSTMGVTKTTRTLHNYDGGNPEVKALAEKHIKTEEANIQQMKTFL